MVHQNGFFQKKGGDLFDTLKMGQQHGTFITFSISQILNTIVQMKGDCENQHSIGMANARKLEMLQR